MSLWKSFVHVPYMAGLTVLGKRESSSARCSSQLSFAELRLLSTPFDFSVNSDSRKNEYDSIPVSISHP